MATASQYFQPSTVATLPAPWSMAFLPDGRMLVTERAPGNIPDPTAEGHIRVVTQAGNVSAPITGVPNNIGVLDVILAPDFAQNHTVYFSYLERDPSAPRVGNGAGNAQLQPAGIAVARAVLDVDNPSGPTLTSTSVIWHQLPKIVAFPGSGEPGGRLAFSPGGDYLYFSAGDRQEFGPVQTLDDSLGKIIRLYPDGTVPTDNPFADVAGALPEIWSTGHRNPYGLLFDSSGVLWENEMGPMGGDELNIIQPGKNYGWPNVSYGDNYGGAPIPKPAPGDGYAGSVLTWTPVIAPSSMIAYSGTAFPQWQGDFILSGLQSKGLVIVDVNGTTASELIRIDLGARTRDVVQGPDGSLWVLYDQPDGRLVKLEPLQAPSGGSGSTPSVDPTPLQQGNVALTALPGGNFVGVWNDDLTGGGSGLKAQIYTSDGQKSGSEIVLNQTTAGDQGLASITATASGGFAVAYGSRDVSGFNIYLQAYAADGMAAGSKILVNSGLASFHSPPEVSVLSGGHIAVAWLGADIADNVDVRVQLFMANGTKIGGEILGSDHPGTGKIGEQIVALTGGGFALSWTDYGVETDAYGNGNTAVRAQIFDGSGNKVGSTFTVNTASAGNQDLSSLAALPNDGFIATWRDDGYAYASSTGTQGIWAQLIGANGTKIGTPVHVTNAGEYGYAPAVTILPGIGFAIAWQTSPGSATDSRTLMSRLFDFNAQPLGPEFSIASDVHPGLPTLAGAANGSLIFNWAGISDQASNDHTTAYNTVVGSSGANSLAGTAGKDLIFGENGADTIAGNAGVDILSGGDGNDIFRDTAAGLSGDTITDFAIGDKIVITDAALAGFSFALSGHTLTYTGGSLNLTTVPAGGFVVTANSGGGVSLSIRPPVPINNFNGDGFSDVLWRNDNGALTSWFGKANGGFTTTAITTAVSNDWHVAGTGDFNGDSFSDLLWRNDNGALTNWLGSANGATSNDAAAYQIVTTDWQVAGTGDFNGDGRSDILWRNADGRLSNWLGTVSGGFTDNGGASAATVALSWQVAGTGDFNGDGRDDILWRNTDGQLSDWLGTASGGFIDNGAVFHAIVSADWRITSTGDFNGDGRSDIFWHNDDGRVTDWLGTASGGFTDNTVIAQTSVSTDWHVSGTGNIIAHRPGNDFNGDGRSDILWRNTDGQLSNWLGTANGGFTDNGMISHTIVSTAWQIAGTGDFNGDGRSDILWRNTDGQLSNWLGTANGGFTDNGAVSHTTVSTAWQIAGTGDFNGDGRSDILWRNTDGQLSDWLGTANGGFTDNGAVSHTTVATAWQIAGTGDFNGDGRSDILWRNTDGQLSDWLGTANGGFTDNSAASHTSVATAWKIAGTGDFNGDGRSDILWRNTDGQLSNWLGTANGGFTDNGAVSHTTVSTAWQIAGTGDFNGDGRSDILWRNTDGQLSDWLGTANGGFTDNGAVSHASVATDWHIQNDSLFIV